MPEPLLWICVPADVCVLLCCHTGRGLPGIHRPGLAGVEIAPSSQECALSIEKVFSGTWSPQPGRGGCCLQLLGTAFQCALTNTSAGTNGCVVVVPKGSCHGLQTGCSIRTAYPRADGVNRDAFAFSLPPRNPVDAAQFETGDGQQIGLSGLTRASPSGARGAGGVL